MKKDIKASPTLALDAKAKELIRQGRDIISFGAGEPDFDSPESAKEGGKIAIDKGFTKYTPVDGIPELKKSVVEKFEKFFGVKYSEDEVIVTAGAKMAIFLALVSILEDGDEVLIPSPYWVSYPDMVKLVGGIPKIVGFKEDFSINIDELYSLITPKTRAIILNSPSNPTGRILRREELEDIAEISREKDIYVISDEIYGTLVYDTEFESFAKFERERTITIWGMSKTYSMTGWRIGFAFGRKDIISDMKKIQSQTTSNPTSISQYASLYSLKNSDEFVKRTTEIMRRRRDLIYGLIKEIPYVKCFKPEGAFYIFPDVSNYLGEDFPTTSKLSEKLLDDGVLVIPGDGFGAEGYIRLSFATSEEKIKEGIRRLKESLQKIKK